MNQNKDIGLIWEAYQANESQEARANPTTGPDWGGRVRMQDYGEKVWDAASKYGDLELSDMQKAYDQIIDASSPEFEGLLHAAKEQGYTEDDLSGPVIEPKFSSKERDRLMGFNEDRQGGGRPINPGFGSDGNEPEKSLADYGLKMTESREDDDDRYWETWELRATTREAAEKFGHGPIDWIYRNEIITRRELEQQVLANIERTGKPRFDEEGVDDPNPWA